MENSGQKNLLRFLAEQEKLTEQRLQELNMILEGDIQCPDHILDTLHHLRQNAEDDLSNILHIQSIHPSPRHQARQPAPARRRSVVAEGGAVLGVLPEEGGAETDPAAGGWGGGGGRGAEEELFTLDGVTAPHSASTLSDEEREQEDSEPDEGVHMWVPGESDKYRMRNRHERGPEVAASLPVGIPWPAQLTLGAAGDRQLPAVARGQQGEDQEKPRDIAASIQVSPRLGFRVENENVNENLQAMARSVHTSSIFGDSVFGELPRPRVNTFSKD